VKTFATFTTSVTQEWKVTGVTATARPSNSQKKSQRSWTKKTDVYIFQITCLSRGDNTGNLPEDDKDKHSARGAKADLQQVVEKLVFWSEKLQESGKNRNDNNHPRAVAHDICVCRGSD
jgi:hypothetical protein